MNITRGRTSEQDLFSPDPARDHLPSSAIKRATSSAIPQLALPQDLPNAVKHLNDRDLGRLAFAVTAEQKRRGKQLTASSEKRVETVLVPLTRTKVNAVRAAFKAGVKPSQIARQFGISQSEVRKALSGKG